MQRYLGIETTTTRPPMLNTSLSDADVVQLLDKAAKQYEEYLSIVKVTDYPEPEEVFQPRYAWDNPMGLVITKPLPVLANNFMPKQKNAELVRAAQ